MDNKIAYSLIIGAMLLSTGGLVAYNSFQPNTYYCEPSKTVMKCDSLSAYYGLSNGKCINKQLGNKLCKTGWMEITNDKIIEQNTSINKWLCSTESCIPMN